MIRLHPGSYFGSSRATRTVSGVTISENLYAPDAFIPSHLHERPFVCIVAGGSFVERSGRSTAECGVGSVIWHPGGDAHEDSFGQRGGTCLGLDFDSTWLDRFMDAEPLPDAWRFDQGPQTAWLGNQIASELERADALSSFALEGLTLALVATLVRSAAPMPPRRPAWLDSAVVRLRDEFRDPPTVAELARDASVHRSHFSRVFHHHMRTTVAEFLRRLRIEWASHELRRSNTLSLADISVLAGFADQAHFSRAFKCVMGCPPGQFREQTTGRGIPRRCRRSSGPSDC
jgi:AraC family transcriptional regulator